ncbi:uncharacterized protein LOC132259754 [Phlebotomus argentipes]|uniref:uncharacterized protein LOC132259754 n=1 Tax=Phlebotomus argentipes TaxID=94469 RepID=UPI002892FEB5|nr:uncharacterized protein LOC132259754 [Phlebotomus argentipes]
MANLKTENLTERMERIRLKNEEIEKKHREAMEDRLAAVKNNAMVAIKPPSDEEWPRQHKYDTLDFTYDSPEAQIAEKARPEKTTQALRGGKEHKKFALGQGPPPDPVYNFLADAERDGGTPQQPGTPRPNNQEGGGKGGQWKQSSGYRNRNGPAGGSFRQNRGKPREQRFERQKSSGDAKWKGSNQPQRPVNAPQKAPPNTGGELVTEKRGNITISVSQDGEIKSVKLASPPVVPGSGRIGIRPVNMPKAPHFTNSSPLHKNSSHQHFVPAKSQPHHHLEHHNHPTIKSSGVQSRLERNRQMAAETIAAEN